MGFFTFRRPVTAAAVAAPVVVAAKGKSRLAAGTALAALCCSLLVGFEGMRTRAYIPIPGDVPTVCVGETKGIRMGMTFTKPQCEAMCSSGSPRISPPALERCVTRPMGDDVYAAFLSLSYNIGSAGFCRSSVARLYNAGDRRGSCHAILAFDKAGGRVVPGLVRRRKAEEALCLKGV